jgi:hypothetical protein
MLVAGTNETGLVREDHRLDPVAEAEPAAAVASVILDQAL